MRVGLSVKHGDKLMALVNQSHLWLWANFYENEVGLLKEGGLMTVVFPASQIGRLKAKSVLLPPRSIL
jgi:multidrug resistance efflux pump